MNVATSAREAGGVLHGTPVGGGETMEWRRALDKAIQNTDESEIWRIMRVQSGNEEAQEALATMVSRLAYVSSNQRVYCEVFMMPVIQFGSHQVTQQKKVWMDAKESIAEAIHRWLPKESVATIFEGVLPMDWVTTWTPAVLRSHLKRLVPGSNVSKVQFLTETIDLPEEAPRLGFLTMACARRDLWPEVPCADGARDARLKSVIKFSLQTGAEDFERPTVVMTPERVQFAVTDGIVQWLSMLHESVGIVGYSVMPSQNAIDVVKVVLRLKSETTPATQFTLRLHQIGPDGFHDVLSVLSSIAPSIDVPMDMNDEQLSDFLLSGHLT